MLIQSLKVSTAAVPSTEVCQDADRERQGHQVKKLSIIYVFRILVLW